MQKEVTYTRTKDNCWEITSHVTSVGLGYAQIERKGRRLRSNRWAWEKNFGPIPEGFYVCHTCDNPACINPDHLFLGTPRDNSEDMVRKGRVARQIGSTNGAAKLTEEDIPQIRALHENGLSQRKIATMFLVSQRTIGRILNHQTWRHIDGKKSSKGHSD